MLSKLTPREQKVLRMRFGIGERQACTLEEIGQTFNLTRERIRQIEAKALEKLRKQRGVYSEPLDSRVGVLDWDMRPRI